MVSIALSYSDIGSRGSLHPHQRCDGKRPCATCVGREGAECIYAPLPSKTSAIESSLTVYPTRPPSDDPLPTGSVSGKYVPPPLSPCERPLAPGTQPPWEPSTRLQAGMTLLGPLSDASAARNIHDTTECIPRPTGPPTTALPFVNFRTTPQPPRVPLSVQIPPIVEGDLDVTLYGFPASEFRWFA